MPFIFHRISRCHIPPKSLLGFFFCLALLLHADDSCFFADGERIGGIIPPSSPSSIDKFALKELREHLEKITGHRLPLLQRPSSEGKYIFIGQSASALQRLGRDSQYSLLKAQDSVIQGKRGDLFLYGKGRHGNLYAVYEYLENKLGCRWLSAFGDCHIPKLKFLPVPEGVTVTTYAFPQRALMNHSYQDKKTSQLFLYRNRQNLLIDSRPEGIQPLHLMKPPAWHTLNRLLPGCTVGINRPAEWHRIKDYYQIHPEWFSMDENGKRVNTRQLCFSNPNLRKELTRNALHDYRLQIEKEKEVHPDGCYLSIDLNDTCHTICCCPACKALQQKYGTPGGAFFDYLIEICGNHPEIQFATLAYQSNLTLIPPKNVRKLKNLTVIFCPIGGNFAGTLTRENRSAFNHLKNWTPLVKSVWLWYYPNAYNIHPWENSFLVPTPVGNFERLAADIQTMHDIKIGATFFEHDAGGVDLGINLAEMQTWVMLKLFENPDRPVHRLMKDFAEHYYGKAAPSILQFAEELEQERKKLLAAKKGWGWNTQDHPGFTPRNLKRWDQLFTEASSLVAGEEEFRLRLARLGLDGLIIKKEIYRDCPEKQQQCIQRIFKTFQEASRKRPIQERLEKIKMKEWFAYRKWLKQQEPIPASLLKQFSEDRIQTVLPSPKSLGKISRIDKNANGGLALGNEPWDKKEFRLPVINSNTGAKTCTCTVPAEKISLNQFELYEFPGFIQLAPGMKIQGKNQFFNLNIGKFCRQEDLPSLRQKWRLFVSLKFTGNQVLMDRAFLVRHP